MKTKNWIAMLLLPVMTACNSFNNRGLIDNPQVVGRSSDNSIEVEMVEVTDTATVLHIKAYYYPNQWIKIASSSFLRDNHGNMYAIVAGDGIELNEEFWMPESGEAAFNLIFQPIPSDVTSIDFSEGDEVEGAFKVWGIQLTGKPVTVELPKEYKQPVADPAAPLPAVTVKAGTAHLNGQILNYVPDMGKEIELYIYYPFTTASVTVAIDKEGKFATDVEAFSPHPVTVHSFAGSIQCFIAPDETTTVLINPTEIARQKSHLHKDDPARGKAVYFGGFLAALNQEMEDNHTDIQRIIGQSYNTRQEYYDFLRSFTDKSLIQVREMMLKQHADRDAAIDATTYSTACKELLHITNDLNFSEELGNARSYVTYAYALKHNLMDDRDAMNNYSRSVTYPPGYFDVLRQFKYINSPERCYSNVGLRDVNAKEYLGTDKGYYFDVIAAALAYAQITKFQPLDSAQLAAVPEAYRAYMQKESDKVVATIEANKAKGGYEVKEISPDVDGKDVLPQIIAQYLGKPIMIDIWATWCGPCLTANKALAPVKEELKDRGIVYVFITGETSPKETWNAMIPDLHGVHYYLTDKQWNGILSTYQSNGVPTYFYVDKTGKIVDKQVGYGGVGSMKNRLLEISK
ncbi:MAG: TlpA family protein disulfide reductase [Prevotellaceae bacterium]|nr:TlpA family protein disulfide reductase [Prevotellaceae bacterium]